MQTFIQTALSLIKTAPAIDKNLSAPDAEPVLAAPMELDAAFFRHVGGGVEEIETPVVCW